MVMSMQWSRKCRHSFLLAVIQALRAQYLQCHHLQALHLLRAELWDEAHTVVVDHLVPDAIINGETI